MTRWKLIIEYDGTNFSGWQRQADAPSVQQTLEDAIKKFSAETVTLHVAGRTDAGVHALAQVAHFDLLKETDADTVRDAINFYVRPHKVVVLGAERMTADFHARFGAESRRYRYQVLNRRPPPALLAGYCWHIIKPLSLAPMQEAANLMLGTHNFSTFRAQDCQAKSPIKTLSAFQIRQDGEMLMFETEARSFLYHQVRNMVGTLTMVGTGQWTLGDFSAALAACDRAKGGPTAPAHGLFFCGVVYAAAAKNIIDDKGGTTGLTDDRS